MNPLVTKQLVENAARIAQKEREAFSKVEIAKRINEIKYLSAQKKVPKLSLRKEIIQLESQLQGIFELEKKLLKEKSKENVKIDSLNRQIKTLKNRLKLAGNKDLSKKVDRLSHLLAEHLARVSAEEAVDLQKKITEQTSKPEKKLDPETIKRVRELRKRLDNLEHEIRIHKELETKRPEEMEIIEKKTKLIEEKLTEYYKKHPELLKQEFAVAPVPKPMAKILPAHPVQVKHHMRFPVPQKITEEELEIKVPIDHLPLPPPPRIKKE